MSSTNKRSSSQQAPTTHTLPTLPPGEARPSKASPQVAKGVDVLTSSGQSQWVLHLASRHHPCAATSLPWCNGSSCVPDESRHQRINALAAGYRTPTTSALPLPVLVKFEAYACLRNATLPSPMSSVRDPVSSASSTDFLSIQRKCVSSLALVPLGHPWPCVVECRAGRPFDANNLGHTLSWPIPGSWAWPGFPNRGQHGLRLWAGSPVLPAFDQSCQPPAPVLHSTFSLDRLDDTEGRIVDMDRST